MAGTNPMSFLRVNKPEINLPPDTDIYSDEVYEAGRQKLKEFIDKKYLIKDSKKTFYLY